MKPERESKVPITQESPVRTRLTIQDYVRDNEGALGDEPFVDPKTNLITIGTVYRGQGRYLPWFFMEREPDAIDEAGEIYGWKITDAEREAWPELVGRKGVTAKLVPASEGHNSPGVVEVVRKSDQWVLMHPEVVIPRYEDDADRVPVKKRRSKV